MESKDKFQLINKIVKDYAFKKNITVDDFNIETYQDLLKNCKSLNGLLESFCNNLDQKVLNRVTPLTLAVINFYLTNNSIELEDRADLYDRYEEEIDSLDSIQLFIRDISQYKVLTKEEEFELFKQLQQGNTEVNDIIIKSNLRLVVNIAKMYAKGNKDMFLDYVQEGTLVLIKAIDKFDITKGYKLSCYATAAIHANIRRYINNTSKLIRIPEKNQLLNKKIESLSQQYYLNNGTEITNQELAEILNVSVELIKLIKDTNIKVISMNQTIKDDDDTTIEYFIEDDTYKSTEELAIEAVIKEQILSILKEKLNPKELYIINSRFGLDNTSFKTLEQLRTEFGCNTSSGIEMVRKRAFNKLKRNPRIKEYQN